MDNALTDLKQGHTPGPWLRVDTADYAEISAASASQAVALVGKPADADLIAAAPDYAAEVGFLLDRLSDLDWCGDMDAFAIQWEGHVSPSVERLAMIHEAAIAKATGAA